MHSVCLCDAVDQAFHEAGYHIARRADVVHYRRSPGQRLADTVLPVAKAVLRIPLIDDQILKTGQRGLGQYFGDRRIAGLAQSADETLLAVGSRRLALDIEGRTGFLEIQVVDDALEQRRIDLCFECLKS